jgi:hypothetical protein
METLTTSGCGTTPSAIERLVDGQWVIATEFNDDAAYPNYHANEFTIGEQASDGTTTSGAPVGSVQTVRACTSWVGGESCDPPTTVTVKDCCVPLPCSDTACGTVSDGCGGTITCSAGCNVATCPPQTCPAGAKWDKASCACEHVCTTPACACRAAGGDWDGHSCT